MGGHHERSGNEKVINHDTEGNRLENEYIRSSKANVDHIMASWQELKTGQVQEHDWKK